VFPEHPNIRPGAIEPREYQIRIAESALRGNTLVVLPTGLGKTIIAAMVAAERLNHGRVLFLAPTKPLVMQHLETFRGVLNIPEEEIVAFTGEVKREKRARMWREARVIISTPQVVENDVIAGIAPLEDFSLLIVDEAHRAVGNYAYVLVAEEYRKRAKNPLVLAITASPGSVREKLDEIIANLGIERAEIRTEKDRDVRKYVHPIRVKIVHVEMPEEVRELHSALMKAYEAVIAKLREFGLLHKKRPTRSDLLAAQREVSGKIAETREGSWYTAMAWITAAIKVDYALEYLETQGVEACLKHLESIVEDASKRGGSRAARMLVEIPEFLAALSAARRVRGRMEEIENPKLEVVKELVRKTLARKPDARIIVFTQYRKTAALVAKALESVEGARPVRFVGQASRGEDRGLRQREQVEIVEKFRNGEYNVLVATSVAEEGLDIPSTDAVIFYEPVPSEIRSIQRRGRTGRRRAGTVYIIATRGTRDQAYYWSSRSKEKRMLREMEVLREQLSDRLKFEEYADAVKEEKKDEADEKKGADVRKKEGQRTLFDFAGEDSPEVVVDSREMGGGVVRHLMRKGVRVTPQSLPVGDYVISDRVVVERKTSADFASSLFDGRLFEQAGRLKEAYERPIVIVEGGIPGNIPHGSAYGAIASLAVDYGIPVLFTRGEEETAEVILALLRRERAKRRDVAVRGQKRALSDDEKKRAVVESLPGVSATLAKRLLEEFGTVRGVIDASPGELMQVRGVGRKTAEGIFRLVNERYGEG